MTLKSTPFDPADSLDTKNCRSSCSPTPSRPATADISRMRLERSRVLAGWRRSRKRMDFTRQALYRSLSETGDPRLTTLLRVSKSLGLKLSFEAA